MAAPSPMPAVEHPTEKPSMLDRQKSITFKGKLFYLDLPHNKKTQVLTEAICTLGGVIEGFLSKDVNYVVTGSRKALDNVNGSSVTSRRGGHCKRQAAENVEPVLCRGKQLLKKAIKNQERSSVLANAQSWGVCILHMDEVLKHLEHATNVVTKTVVVKNAAGAKVVKTIKVGKLKRLFLKIEDESRKYRPLACCFSSFPEISFISSDRSPFETTHTNSTHKEKDAGDQDDDQERSQRPHAREKSGFCECCRVTYTKLSEHLISEQHSQFALDNSNYKSIDDIANNLMCDLMEYPCGIMSIMEGVVADDPFNVEDTRVPVLKEESKMVVPEVLCEGNGAVTPVEENCAAHVGEEHMPDMVQRQPVKNVSPSEQEEDMNVTKDDGDPVECNGQIHPIAEDTNNILIQCKGQLQEKCDTEVASHVDVVTEVSWYTEEAGLTSVYTVQSLVIPPDGQHAQMTMANALAAFSPPLLLSPLSDHGTLGPEHPFVDHNPSVVQDFLPGTQVTNTAGAHRSELLVEQMSVLEVGKQLQGIAEPPTGNLCGINLLDALVQLPAGERRPEEMVNVQVGSIRLHEQLLTVDQNDSLLNASASLHTPVDRALSQEHLNVIPLYEGPAATLVVTPPSSTLLTNNSDRENQLIQGLVDTPAVPHRAMPSENEASALEQKLNVMPLSQAPAELVHNTTPLDDKARARQHNRLNVMPLYQGSAVEHSSRQLVNEASTPEQSELQSTMDFCRGKRKHCCSSPPPAKRQPCQCKPLSLPTWAFHQLSNSGLEHAANGLPNLMKREKKFVANEGTVDSPNPYFNPKLIQYNASSESDWDSGLLSQQSKHQQGAQLGDLRTAQVNLDESWYGRELGSVLAQDHSLGSPTTQTVTLAHTSYDLLS